MIAVSNASGAAQRARTNRIATRLTHHHQKPAFEIRGTRNRSITFHGAQAVEVMREVNQIWFTNPDMTHYDAQLVIGLHYFEAVYGPQEC